MAAQTKYRPSLTAAEVAHMLTLAHAEVPMSTLSVCIISRLAPFLAKIDNLGVKPAYITTSKPALKANSLESLGDIEALALASAGISKEEVWEAAYTKYAANPTLCSLREISEAREHMYLNDLMSDSEATAFELGEL